MEPENKCRCGHDLVSNRPHPCHAFGYRCRQPATLKTYKKPIDGYTGTYACPSCWDKWVQKHPEDY